MANEFMDVLKQNVIGGAIGAVVVYALTPGVTMMAFLQKIPALPDLVTKVYGMIPGGETAALVATVALGYVAGAYIQKMLK